MWRDTDNLWPGEDWRAKIRRAITDDALVFIACFSRNSLNRRVSYQNAELALAIEQMRLRRPDDPWLIPVRFDECDIPEWDIGGGRTLASIQRADLFGNGASKSFERLVATILRMLGQQTPLPAEGYERIVVYVGEEPQVPEAFIGMWLVVPDGDETRTREKGNDAGAYWGVALTQRGKIAVYVAHVNERWPADLNVYESLR